MAETKVILSTVAYYINVVLGALVAGSLLLFLWGMVRSYVARKNPEVRSRANDLVMRGATSAIILGTSWSIIVILFKIFGITASY